MRISVVVLLSVILACMSAALMGCPPSPSYVTVPNVLGQTQAAAEALLTGADLAVGAVTQAFHATIPAGQVISQNPASGASVSPGSAIALVVSKGSEPPLNMIVPNVVGKTQAEATASITAAGLKVGAVTQAFHATIPAGQVISQNPASGASVASGSAVALVISKGAAPPQNVTVPNVVGITQAEATASIMAAGLTTGGITEEYSVTIPAGQVISQNPASGASVAPGSAIALVVSKGPLELIESQTILLPGDVPLVMVWIPGGTFQMGGYPGEEGSGYDEDPQHQVTLTGFWMAKYELTKRQWKAVMSTEPWSGYDYVLDDLDSPAVLVSWDDAKVFITALNSHTGKTFRLPSESEWEYAYRAGSTTRYYWGDDMDITAIDAYAWYSGNNGNIGEQYARIVGQKLPNAFGLYDMSGNVWEWCEDDMHDDYTGAPANGSAWVDAPRAAWRVLRGGSWYDFPVFCRAACRVGNCTPDSRGDVSGFRLTRTQKD